jgi:tetratricopeptide (TPR) repeat protein
MSDFSLYNYDEIKTGISLLWNNKFDEAERIFSTQEKISPRYALHNAEVAFLRSFITADINDTQKAMTRLQAVTSLSQACIKAYESGHLLGDPTKKISDPIQLVNRLIDAKIVYGDSLYMTAILQMSRDAKIKGAFNLRKSWKVFENVLKESKSIKELNVELSRCLQFGAGFFLFAISIIPSKFLKLVELAGFKADRDAGLHYVRDAHRTGGIRAPFATMLLLFNDLLLPRGLANVQSYMVEAEELIRESMEKYPQGSLFQVMGSHCARKQCNVDLGLKYMEMALQNCSNLKSEPLIYKYELANCYCMKMEFSKAVDQFLPLIKDEKFQVRIISALQLGGCYMMIENQKKSLEIFQQIQVMSSKKSSLDQMAQRQAKRYLENGGFFSAFELLYLRRDLAKMIPIMPKVLEELEKMAAKTKATEKKEIPKALQQSKLVKFGTKLSIGKKKDINYAFDDRAAYLLIKGSIIKALGKTEDSVEFFKEVIEMSEVLVEKLYLPYCCYELGESYYILGKLKEAEEYMKKCSKYSGYDWEDPLRVRLRVTMDQLKKGEKPSSQTPPSLDALSSMMEETNLDDKEIDEKDIEKLEANEKAFEENDD